MNTEKYILHNKFAITPRDADFRRNLRISSLINFYTHSSWQHAEKLGLGVSHLSESDFVWFLSRFKIKINKLPVWPGDISIKTWPKGLNRLFYLRDAEIFNTEAIKLASLTSGWLVIDKNSKRPKLYESEKECLYYHENLHAINEVIPTLKFNGKPDKYFNFKVLYNDIDLNYHLTTARYLDFMFDTYGIEFIKTHTPKEITVNFLKEVPFGTDILIKRYDSANIHNFELINKSNEQVCFRGEVKF